MSLFLISVHPCDKAESPCKNGACEENGDEFLCICNEDWTGPTCEEKGMILYFTEIIARSSRNYPNNKDL